MIWCGTWYTLPGAEGVVQPMRKGAAIASNKPPANTQANIEFFVLLRSLISATSFQIYWGISGTTKTSGPTSLTMT